MKKKQKFILLPKVEGFRQNVSVDTLKEDTTNSTDFFRENPTNCCRKTKHFYKLLSFWRQLLSYKTPMWQMEYSFDNPAFLAKNQKIFVSALKKFAEALGKVFESNMNFLQ